MTGKGSEEPHCGNEPCGQGILTDTCYTRDYYEEHKDAGLDYLVYGEWHRSYAEAITRVTFQETYKAPAVLDVGCACGALLKGFAEIGVYTRVLGIDLSDHMIKLGRRHFGFSN